LKRRQFLLGSTALLSAGVPLLARSQVRPCPPSTVDVAGGTSATTSCNAGDAEADWQLRSTGAGVVWAHDFRSDAEVNNFRWTGGFSGGNDPQAVGSSRAGQVRRITTDGITGGGCLEIFRAAGTTEAGSHWWRPFSPMVGSGNGRGINDPGAGRISAQAYAPTSGGSQINQWGDRGFYGHSSYQGSAFDGTEYYLQMRVKMDPRRASAGMPSVGKLIFQTRTDVSLTTQELVTYSGGLNANNPGKNYFRIYGGGSSSPLDQKNPSSGQGQQPGSDLGLCTMSDSNNRCWAWSGGWDTVMYHIAPGRNGVAESRIRVYAAHPGQTSYSKIWDMVWANSYGSANPAGYNALICSSYNNGNNCPSEFWHRYDQIIFSQQFIPCPQA
jgi:hypothetical protein